MVIAELPRLEDVRLAELEMYNLLDTAPEKEFDELRELAAEICNCPVSLITLIDKDRQWFKSKQNIDETETPRDVAFCAHAILSNEVMIVEDAAKDVRFFDNPLVTGPLNIRFYAGAPIVSPAGHNLGTICVIDQQPRVLTKQQERALTILSHQVTQLLELRLKSNLILKRAKDLIALNEESATALIKQKDEESLFVAKQLHENIAQDLATVRLYLNMLQTDGAKQSDLITVAEKALSQALANVKDLSYGFSPTTLETSDLHQLLENLIATHRTSDTTIKLDVTGYISLVSFLQALSCTRIVEAWLDVLFQQKDLRIVHVKLEVGSDIRLTIIDDAGRRSFEEREKELFIHSLYYRVVALNGRVRFVEPAEGFNELHILLPLLQQ
ncbi:GAF domain-containing protein [Lacibacter cauensis]|uniref:GAF domain-containing protein n=1 Tax=Lacibacter cauensis TaxID=510947 RepID=A0A562SGP8_9BACT|nr:GAF domain-containing protein [Lacibacter cauensis]TWI80422.1 GAF domain-containing protein [Lacibacter cauensis]